MKKYQKILVLVLVMVVLMMSISLSACSCSTSYTVTKELFIAEYSRLTKVKDSTPYTKLDCEIVDLIKAETEEVKNVEIAFDKDYGYVYVVKEPVPVGVAFTGEGIRKVIDSYSDKYSTMTYAYHKGEMWIICNYNNTENNTTGHYEWYFNSEGFLTSHLEKEYVNGVRTLGYQYTIIKYYK